MNKGIKVGLGLIGLGILAMLLMPDPAWQLAESMLVMLGCLVAAAAILPSHHLRGGNS